MSLQQMFSLKNEVSGAECRILEYCNSECPTRACHMCPLNKALEHLSLVSALPNWYREDPALDYVEEQPGLRHFQVIQGGRK